VPITRQKSPVFSIVSLPTDSVIIDHAVLLLPTETVIVAHPVEWMQKQIKKEGTILNGDGKLAVELLILWKSCFIIN
jgi:hypothetical protein